MHISFDTNEALTALDVKVLSLLVNGGEVAEVKTPKKKAVKRESPKNVEEEAPEPIEGEPVAEIAEEPEETEEGDTSDEELLDLAVKKATEMVSNGDAAQVREALDAAGAGRVRELNSDNVREFFKALS